MVTYNKEQIIADLRKAMEIGLPSCREEIARANAEGREPSRIALEMLPMWEFIEKEIDSDPDGLLEILDDLRGRPISSTPL